MISWMTAGFSLVVGPALPSELKAQSQQSDPRSPTRERAAEKSLICAHLERARLHRLLKTQDSDVIGKGTSFTRAISHAKSMRLEPLRMALLSPNDFFPWPLQPIRQVFENVSAL